MKPWFAVAISAALVGCASTAAAPSPQDLFFARLSELCGQAFSGRVATADPADAAFASQLLVVHVRNCSENEIRAPFHVGDDRSRTWVITRNEAGLRLKHDHRHADGSVDALTQYGGDTLAAGSAERQEFPADDFSKTLFRDNDIPQSADNVWAIEIRPGEFLAYELRRPNRHFRVEFDLRRAVPAPPPPWGHE
jgi:hypothetical protein